MALAVGVATALAVFFLASLVNTRTHDMAANFYIASMAALTGAILSLVSLRRLQPIEDRHDFARTIEKVFA